jgi:peptide/nickel transport system permease protein
MDIKMKKGEKSYKFKSTGGIKEFLITIWNNKMSRVGLIILLVFLGIAVIGPMVLEEPKADYLQRLKPPSREHILGTDYSGKDTLVQLILGSKDVLLVAFWAGVISIFIACNIGIVSGMFGGKIDAILMMIANIVVTIPSFPVTMILSMIIKIGQ